MDVTTALRFHPGELLISCAYKALWILIWGPSLWGLICAEIAITSFSQFHHSNIGFYPKVERWVRQLIITPVLHASHHSIHMIVRNQNYGTVFSLWDRLFKTYHRPQEKDTRELGIEEMRDDKKAYSFRFLFLGPWQK